MICIIMEIGGLLTGSKKPSVSASLNALPTHRRFKIPSAGCHSINKNPPADRIGHRANMPRRVARHDDHVLKEVRFVPGIDHDDIIAVLLLYQLQLHSQDSGQKKASHTRLQPPHRLLEGEETRCHIIHLRYAALKCCRRMEICHP